MYKISLHHVSVSGVILVMIFDIPIN